jgi:predicted Co/Zn/Cd cation transporter (cation efflux family)
MSRVQVPSLTPCFDEAVTDRSRAARTSTREQRALTISMVGAIVLGVLGVVWGLVSGSRIVLFDGVYAFIGVALAGISLRTARVIEQGPTQRYPFGREALAPLVIAAQALVLLGTCLYASVDAVLVIRDGGTEVAAVSVLAYAAITLLAAVGLAVVLRRQDPDSDLVAAEVTQWRAGVLLSVAMVVGFGFGAAVRSTSWSGAADYVDPVLVLVACVTILPAPFTMLRTTFGELLEATPADTVQAPVLEAIGAVTARFGLEEPRVRMNKLGRKLYVEVDYVVAGADWTVADEDDVRHAMTDALAPLGHDLWLNVDLSTDPAWGA